MGLADLIWMGLILGGCFWLLWRFLWVNKGSCPGCDGGSPPPKRK